MYKDALYGAFSLPGLVRVLVKTPEFRRLENISMDSLPAEVVPYEVTDRSKHCLGVLRLALEVMRNNEGSLSAFQKNLFTLAASMHDMGNSALSHLAEPFLGCMTGKDGESFLWDTLKNSASAEIMEWYGISPLEVVAMVTGDAKPFSDVLHGSMDVDNLDNVLRYEFTATGERSFNAMLIASSFRFRRGRWELLRECLDEARKWQKARAKVYGIVYGSPHCALAMMTYRAVDLVFRARKLPEVFFRFTDVEAFDFLWTNDDARPLIEAVRAGRPYEEVVGIETTVPERGLRLSADRAWNARGDIAAWMAAQTGIPAWAVCAYCGKGRDARKITVPFVDDDGKEYWDDLEADPIYRLKVFVHPEFADNASVRKFANMLLA